MRTLNTTVMVDGVVYEAGTREQDIEGEVTAEGVWDGEYEAAPDYEVPASFTEVEESTHENTAKVRELIEYLVEFHLEDKGTSVSDLLKAATAVFGDDEPEPEPAGADYGSMDKARLQAAIDERNADRDDDAKIQVTGTGSNGNVVMADLVAALEADDAASKA